MKHNPKKYLTDMLDSCRLGGMPKPDGVGRRHVKVRVKLWSLDDVMG